MSERAIAELERTRANMIQYGVIEAADYGNARVRVKVNDLTTAWIPWTVTRAGGDRSWVAPEIGEQVVIACPDGDPARGVVLGTVYQADYAAPAASADISRTVYGDGTVVEYDRADSELNITLAAGGKVNIVGDVTITGDLAVIGDDVTITADVTLIGSLTSTGDQVAGTVSQKTHVHTQVQPGGGLSGIPQQ